MLSPNWPMVRIKEMITQALSRCFWPAGLGSPALRPLHSTLTFLEWFTGSCGNTEQLYTLLYPMQLHCSAT